MPATPQDEDQGDMEREAQAARGPVLLCYDGSEFARRAIQHAGAVAGGGPAIVLTVFETVGSVLLRHPFPEWSEVGRDLKEISEAVVDELDDGTQERAQATADEGVEIARAAGFDAQSVVKRAVARAAERDSVTVWHAILEAAEESDARVAVLGARGRSMVESALLGSVSYGVVHHSTRPVLIVPPQG